MGFRESLALCSWPATSQPGRLISHYFFMKSKGIYKSVGITASSTSVPEEIHAVFSAVPRSFSVLTDLSSSTFILDMTPVGPHK